MGDEDEKWRDAIVSTLQGGGEKQKLPVKELRKAVLLSMQLDTSDKKAKKQFKKVVQSLEEDATLSLNAEGIVKLKKKDKKKKSKRKSEADIIEESESKKAKLDHDQEDGQAEDEAANDGTDDILPQHENKPSNSKDKNKPCKGNPQGVTRLFLGNLPFSVDEASLGDFLPGTLTHIKWITDKETGKFYGSAFCEMDTSENAAAAVAKAGQQLMGRPVKINFAPSRPGDIWPPVKKVVTGGGGGGQAGGSGVKAMSEKPENCMKLFVGNLSYDIDDEGITKFFSNVDAEVKAVRWIHHKDSGDFKGVGFVEFWNTEACEKAASLNGKTLLGRPIRIDWTD